jgi:hypothetical protein
VACVVGKTCWIVNYPDADASKESRDFTCGRLTYDGHKGTDFAVRDATAMRAGTDVLAAADGTVLRVRDGMADRGSRRPSDQACGNGVLIAHEAGWRTQYCHLRRASVSVRPGQAVRRGDRLGAIGMSGRAEFPHVHFEVSLDGVARDPFNAAPVASGCARGVASLWRTPATVAYRAYQIIAAGFAPRAVDLAALTKDAGSPPTIAPGAGALVLWVVMLGVREADSLRLRIVGPDGEEVLDHHREIQKTQIRRMEFAGRKRPGSRWQPGVYVGEATLTRDGAGDTVRVTVTIR